MEVTSSHRLLGDTEASPAEVRAAYVQALRHPEHAHAVCEARPRARSADLAARWRITCPLLVLWSARGPLAGGYAEDGGPVGLWQAWCDEVEGRGLNGGHFFPEEVPGPTADAMIRFFARSRRLDAGKKIRPRLPAG
jgi:haloacetate dehalogenase